jgi:hypothetical protein
MLNHIVPLRYILYNIVVFVLFTIILSSKWRIISVL